MLLIVRVSCVADRFSVNVLVYDISLTAVETF